MLYKPGISYPEPEVILKGWRECKQEVWQGNPDTGAFASYVRVFIATWLRMGDC